MQPSTGTPQDSGMPPAIALDPSTQFGPAAGSMDEEQDLLLIQMRYEECLARGALEELFESGQLWVLGD